MNVSYQIVSYAKLRDGYKPENDKYGIASYEFEARRKAFLANPNLTDFDKTYQYIVLADGVPVGRDSYYPTLMKLDKEYKISLSGSSFNVYPEYRKYSLGLDLLMYYNSGDGYQQLVGGGLSDMAVPLHRKLKFTIFSIPTFLLRRNISVFLQRLGFKGLFLRLFSKGLNPIFNIKEHLFCKTNELYKTFQIKKLQQVPEWVDGIILNDGHKYMEVHDCKWLQWNLDHSFDDDIRNYQEFYALYKADIPVGFFMTKIRVIDKKNSILSGSVMEWGTVDEKVLNEEVINRFALKSFDKNVSYITIGTLNLDVAKRLKKYGFFMTGYEYIIFKDKEKKYKDANDANLWRLRLGYADTILS
jgi:hypothetical protein